jgi:hypothetical protein
MASNRNSDGRQTYALTGFFSAHTWRLGSASAYAECAVLLSLLIA